MGQRIGPEMRPLLRTRNLETAQKNQLLEDIIKTMFPNIDVVHLKIHAKVASMIGVTAYGLALKLNMKIGFHTAPTPTPTP
jgi:hypothetical protein